MRRKLLMLATVVALSSGSAAALSPELAEVDTTEDLVKLCTVKKGSPDYVRALSFCYGYGLGVFTSGPFSPRLRSTNLSSACRIQSRR